MLITPNYKVTNTIIPVFKAKDEQILNNEVQPSIETKTSNKKVCGAVLATALSAAVIAGGVVRGKNKAIKALEKEVGELKDGYEALKGAKDSYVESNKSLMDEITKLKNKIKISFGIDADEIDAAILSNMRIKISEGLDYDYTKSFVINKQKYVRKENGIDFDGGFVTKTKNREYIKPIDIPEIAPDGGFSFSMPKTNQMNVERTERIDFTPVKERLTTVSERYADSVQWDNDKIARDMLQNIFDGHGQTLDGLRLKFTPQADGSFKVRIEGDSTYTPDKAIYIGESTKRNNEKAAGNYGEGLKMATLKLLRDKGAENVRYGSDNWVVDYTLKQGEFSDKRVLAYSLNKSDIYDGNFVEFTTNDRDLLESLRKTINRFYHSHNTHFKTPEFENEVFGIKRLEKGEKGGIYIAGQRFEYDGSYDGLDDFVLFLKKKPPQIVIDISRDRTSLNESQLKDIAGWLSQYETTQLEKIQVMKALEDVFKHKSVLSYTPKDVFLDSFIYYADTGQQSIGKMVNFPEKYVAYSSCSEDICKDLINEGYIICKEHFTYCGMRTIKELIGEVRNHEVVIPNEFEMPKIAIIKQALKSLSKALEKVGFSKEEIDTKILMFSKENLSESNMYKTTNAEAIIDNGISKGFWVDKKFLEMAPFADNLEVALHELCHKVGGDSSAEFSYKLTDVNKKVLEDILNDPKVRKELQALNILWDEVSKKAAQQSV
ncbi:MAG: hypothetical protein E7Z87_01955 [Cyanobacteria bacterium SIG26]|nr:hypothetical protein [Cyanobacteria bacterium SIG26]